MRRPEGRGHVAGRLAVIGWLALVWVLLWGDLSVANVLGGIALGALVVVVLPMPGPPSPGRVRPLRVAVLVGRFLFDLVHGSLQVAGVVLRSLRPGDARLPHGAVVGVQLRTRSELYLTLTAQLATLVPGSLVVEANAGTGMLYLHVLDVELSGGVDAVRTYVLRLEERVLRALAGDLELAEAGLVHAGPAAGEEGAR